MPDTTIDPLIRLEHVSKSYKSGRSRLSILRDISIDFRPGHTVVISGESGVGKSTLLHVLGGLDRADSGRIRVGNNELGTLDEQELAAYRSKSVGFIFQFHYLLNDLTALENIMLPSLIAGVKRRLVRNSARKLLQAIQLEERGSHYPQQLSGGEQQRIAVARALINGPDVILADEPTGNLDEQNSRSIEAMLFLLVRRFGKTLIAVTHDQEMAKRADVHYVMAQGKLYRP